VAIAVVVAAGALAAGAGATIVGTTGAVTKIDPPASVELGALESDTTAFAFDERQDVTLASDLPLDVTASGLVDDKADLTPGVVTKGTKVSSHLVHADRVGTRGKPKLVFDGTVTVDDEILGLAILAKTLDDTDVLGAPGTAYPGPKDRGPSFKNQEDAVTLSADRKTVTIHFQLKGHSDQVRIITAVKTRCRKEDEEDTSSDDSSESDDSSSGDDTKYDAEHGDSGGDSGWGSKGDSTGDSTGGDSCTGGDTTEDDSDDSSDHSSDH
jgi:hypothetical protein